MTNERRVLVHPDKASLAGSVAARFITKLLDILDTQAVAHVVLTGGSMGATVLQSVGASPAHTSIDWSRVHFWWGDERWLPAGDAERNDEQARVALLDALDLPAGNLHPFPAADGELDLDTAAEVYAAELAAHGVDGLPHPIFDITFLGVGPDGHIASLFPHRSGIQVTDRTVIAVRNSPKPPPERLSLTRPVINASQRVWMVLAGADKASALGLALAGASRDEVPVAGIKGRRRTVFFVDADAASEVPESLIARDY
ncbi:6-phosphogluconolactonase [Agromyces fucosus]|uniref:6-phosphogluconolactonase n=1 Tax=Agromyces fucosus TaxID=41985 RepID=A0A4Q2JRG0_9MICO|nr:MULTISPECIES: 6-phosphogluconolactonase [Agromyces]KQZ08396.1 6-phosphogluconolactonase [Agromyces sp. Root1464]RXZ50662.1 6-phosphogluconolactonase [Agromyces fucosus]